MKHLVREVYIGCVCGFESLSEMECYLLAVLSSLEGTGYSYKGFDLYSRNYYPIANLPGFLIGCYACLRKMGAKE